MAENKYSNGNPKVPSIWSVIPSKRVADKRSKQYPTTFLVFCCLAMYTNRAGVCWVGQSRLSKHLGISRPAVSHHINLLLQWDYIRYAKKHKGLKGNKYYMVFDEKIDEDIALSVQTSEVQSEIAEITPVNIIEGPKTMDEKKPSRISRQVMNEFKKIVSEIYGHQAQHKVEHEILIDKWLAAGFTKDHIVSKCRNTIQWRRDNGKDSIKSIVYFKNVFVKGSNKKSNPKEELDQLLSKFINKNKIKY